MLPNRMNLTKQTEERLRRLKQNTGINPNISARIAFFRSYEKGFKYEDREEILDGGLVLDKITWLGDCGRYIELLLNERYPGLEDKALARAWAGHIEHGISGIQNIRSLTEISAVI